MKLRSKLIFLLFCTLYLAFLATIAVAELVYDDILIYIISFSVFFLLVMFAVGMIRHYVILKPQVAKVKKDYLSSLKPEKPLRTYGFMEEEVRSIPSFPTYDQDEENQM